MPPIQRVSLVLLSAFKTVEFSSGIGLRSVAKSMRRHSCLYDNSAKDKSANDTSAKPTVGMPTVRMPTVRKGQQCE